MFKGFGYRFSRIFWSIYFALGIAVIGFLFGYVLTLLAFFVALILSFLPFCASAATAMYHLAEGIQCLSIRMLLRMQPWLSCQTNFHRIIGFYEPLSTRRVMFVANHRSNLDTFLLISYIPGLRGLAKKSLFRNLFFAPFMLMVGFIPVEKGSMRSYLDGLELLNQKIFNRNRSVLIFPENSRCPKGALTLSKFGEAPFALAKKNDVLIVPLAISGTDDILGRGDFWLNPFKSVSIRQLPAVHPRDFASPTELKDSVWNSLKAALA